MSKTKINYKEQIHDLFIQLRLKYPSYGIGRHISAAFAEYGDIWGLSDKEFLFALEKYTMELENNDTTPDELARIIEEGMHLETILDEDEDEEDEF